MFVSNKFLGPYQVSDSAELGKIWGTAFQVGIKLWTIAMDNSWAETSRSFEPATSNKTKKKKYCVYILVLQNNFKRFLPNSLVKWK